MKFRHIIILTIVIINLINLSFANDCTKTPITILPIPKEESLKFQEWVRTSTIPELENAQIAMRNVFDDAKIYKLDINNDGKEEYVLAITTGKVHKVRFHLFIKDEKGSFKILKTPNVINTSYQNTNFASPFIKVCEKNYIAIGGVFNNNGYAPASSPDIYLWEKDRPQRACTSEWIYIHHNIFTKENSLSGEPIDHFYKADQYISGIEEACRKLASPTDLALIKQDMELSRQKICSKTNLKKVRKEFNTKIYPSIKEPEQTRMQESICTDAQCEYPLARFESIIDRCKGIASVADLLWLKNDLALAHTYGGQCKGIIKEIKSDPAYNSTTKAFHAAVEFNSKKCDESGAVA
jgi:hypothetical protein